MRFTIREWLNPKVLGLQLLGFLGAVPLLVFLGPFGTWAILALADRFAFWAITVGVNWVVSYAFAYVVVNVTSRAFGVFPRQLWFGLFLGSLVAALPGTGAVWLAVAAYLDHRPTDVLGLAQLYLQVLVLNVIIGSICFVVTQRVLTRERFDSEPPVSGRSTDDTAASRPAPEPPLLARLPVESRAELLHLRMQDHYVEVHTAVGMELLLMRFRDALREVENVNGLRVHRSHWVAHAAVVSVERRRGGGLTLRLVNGSEVPVSRSFAPTLKDRGWI